MDAVREAYQAEVLGCEEEVRLVMVAGGVVPPTGAHVVPFVVRMMVPDSPTATAVVPVATEMP